MPLASLSRLGLIYQPLVTLSSSLQVVPDLASSWTFSSDSKSVTSTLRSKAGYTPDGSTRVEPEYETTEVRLVKALS
jgi:ABC-type transport system substrate-binding protein